MKGYVLRGVIGLFLLGAPLACTNDGGSDPDFGTEAETAADAPTESDAEPPAPEVCQEISRACHHVDPGFGPMHDCHETAHDVATVEACEAVHDECIALCEAAEADAGTDAEDVDGGDVPADAAEDDTHMPDHGMMMDGSMD
jgi:hypothetical protein